EGQYGEAYRQVSMMNGHLLHNLGAARGEGMLIGILDSGFEGADHYPGFAALRDQGGIAFTKDFVQAGGNVFLTHNHGRMVLSVMAAEIPGRLRGTAPNARYALARTENAENEYLLEEDNWVSGAEWCDSLGCDVLNTSLGYTTFDDPTQDHTYADLDGNTTRISIAARIASERGMIPVNSAGNSGDNEWHYISAPADAEGILTVGAVDNDRRVADFSSRGPTADGRLKPDVSAVGEGTVGLGWDPYNPASGNGTSFSSPLVAGLTACLWQLHPEATNTAIMDAVRRSASHHNDPNDSIGYGIPDYWRAHLLLGGRDLTGLSTDQVLSAAPVPFTDWMDVEVYAGASASVQLQLFDATGRIVWNNTYGVEPGTFNRVRIEGELARLRSGVYMLDARIGAHRSTFRVVKAG
ncbi:MAG TPA: S8 family serine peptidase, partial [Flavobacteriales bacterium]